ncbi:splicing factor 3b subunit 2 isoform X2 [Oratosquilla oratoria]|uniref:splicing factor 3b subunit 2 isoform X2 n=1 Tax=Oratosquilla oratoria TaxID=337810 RepID=UPI003F76897E
MSSEEDFSKLRVVDLKARLNELGLSTSEGEEEVKSETEEEGGMAEMEEDNIGPPGVDAPSPAAPQQQGDMVARQKALEQERLIQEKVKEQQRLIEQQQQQKQQEELYRLQQAALMEKQREEQEKQAQMLRLQQQALKMKEEEERKKIPASVGAVPVTGPGAAPPGVSASVVVPPTASFPSPSAPPLAVGVPNNFSGPTPVPAPSLLGPGPAVSSPSSGPPPNHSQNQQSSIRPLLQTPPQVTLSTPQQAPPGPVRPNLPNAPRAPPPPLNTAPPPIQPGPRPPGTGLLGAAPPSMSNSGDGPDRSEKPPPLMSLQVNAPKEEPPREVKLPQALEQALAFKSERAKQVGVDPEELEKVEREGLAGMDENEPVQPNISSHVVSTKTAPPIPSTISVDDDDDDIETKEKGLEEKGKKKKKKKKKKGRNRFQEQQGKEKPEKNKKESVDNDIEIEYIAETIDLDMSDPMHRHFAKIFETFRISEPEIKPEELLEEERKEIPSALAGDLKKVPKQDDDDDDDDETEKKEDDKPKLSKRKMKLQKRMSVAELKQTVNRPDVVEMHDVTAKDPKLLVILKATRNTVPVPRHWCFKRKYLQGKRGIEKPPFELPEFIKRTGIMEMRAALQEKEDQKTLKAKMRDKVRPKMGKIDIDYQKFHDAFFKWQTKPKMTIHGDLYYEGKEFETKMKDKKPGEMSDDLRIALGMPVGANAHKVPPPWLIAMQRYGPPPSYPSLKIPGLNAPIPEGCSFGYHAGGWGKPPVDNMGKPIYGDVFGTQNKDFEAPPVEEDVEKTMWGELESESEEESDEEDEEEEEEEDESGVVTPGETGLVTPSGISSLPAGLETPDMIELRKKRLETEMEGGDTPALYTVLPEKRAEGVGRAMMGSTHTYDLSAAAAGGTVSRGASQGVEVALDPSELDLVDTEAMAARYEATLREQQKDDDEDFSDMVAEHAAKQRNKRRKQQQDQNKPSKKYKDFKF